jgi:hypothetical protein
MPSWTLVDADPIAAENPYIFYKPSREVIAPMGSAFTRNARTGAFEPDEGE